MRAANATVQPMSLLRRIAVVGGILSALAAVLVPFLPVTQEITTLQWPTAEGTRAVSAPLAAYQPTRLDIAVPCETARDLDARSSEPAVLASTNPPDAPYGDLTGLRLEVNDGQLRLLSQARELGTTELASGDCTVNVHSDGYGTHADVAGQQFAQTNGDTRPQLTGLYSDIDDTADATEGLSFTAEVDDRYNSHPTPLKLVVMSVAVLGCAAALLALHRIDRQQGRRPVRTKRGRWRPTGRDVVVTAVLLAWWLIGAMTADDGYFLTMARARDDLGYVSDFYRWFSGTVAPMGWFVELQARWVAISTATPWIRLPALGMGLVSWLLISRFALPRLGQRVRRSRAAGWAAATVFLACWLPYNNGLRPEPVVVVLAVLVLCLVEYAVATRRLAPAAIGLIGAAFSVGVNPHGMVAVLPFLAAAKPLWHLVRRRADQVGLSAVLAPIGAAGLVVLVAAFSDQTWMSVADATSVRSQIGPSQGWYEELSRYTMLFGQSVDGSLTRRFPVLLMLLCLAMCAVVLLRRGRIRGAALGPSRRLLAVAGLYFVALALTPTKHTHHFGVFAAVGGTVAALTALAASSTVLRSRRNRAVFVAGLMVVLALSATGTNAWWYVSGWGVPWYDKPPSIGGIALSTGFLLGAAIALIVALVEHLKLDERNPPVAVEENRSRALRLGTAPLSIACALLMLFELASLAKVIPERWDTYNLATDNVRQLVGQSCGLSDSVYVEDDPAAGVLPPAPAQPEHAVADTQVPEGESPDQYLQDTSTGFSSDGLPDTRDPAMGETSWTPPQRVGAVMGSYGSPSRTGEVRTRWSELPRRARTGEVPIVVSAAGTTSGANTLAVEFGRDTSGGYEILDRSPIGQDGDRSWSDYRVSAPEAATKVRLVAEDRALNENGWLAASPVRAPRLTPMTEVVADEPAFVEWTAAMVHPCANMTSIHNGIAELPRYRISGGDELRAVGQDWSGPSAGGPFGYLNVATSMAEVPTYLRNDSASDWGSLYEVHPYEPDALPASAATRTRLEDHWGWWRPGPSSKPINLPGEAPASNERSDIRPGPR